LKKSTDSAREKPKPQRNPWKDLAVDIQREKWKKRDGAVVVDGEKLLRESSLGI